MISERIGRWPLPALNIWELIVGLPIPTSMATGEKPVGFRTRKSLPTSNTLTIQPLIFWISLFPFPIFLPFSFFSKDLGALQRAKPFSFCWFPFSKNARVGVSGFFFSIMCKWTRSFWRTDCQRALKASPRPRQPLFAVPALRELESACRVSILWDAVTVPTVCFSGALRGSPEGVSSRGRTLQAGVLGTFWKLPSQSPFWEPFSEPFFTVKAIAGPLLRTLLRTPSPEPCPEPSQNPSQNAVLPYAPLGVHPIITVSDTNTNAWKSKFLYRYRPEGIFRFFFRPDSGPPPVHMLLQRKKANSFVPAIFFPIAWPF